MYSALYDGWIFLGHNDTRYLLAMSPESPPSLRKEDWQTVLLSDYYKVGQATGIVMFEWFPNLGLVFGLKVPQTSLTKSYFQIPLNSFPPFPTELDKQGVQCNDSQHCLFIY